MSSIRQPIRPLDGGLMPAWKSNILVDNVSAQRLSPSIGNTQTTRGILATPRRKRMKFDNPLDWNWGVFCSGDQVTVKNGNFILDSWNHSITTGITIDADGTIKTLTGTYTTLTASGTAGQWVLAKLNRDFTGDITVELTTTMSSGAGEFKYYLARISYLSAGNYYVSKIVNRGDPRFVQIFEV